MKTLLADLYEKRWIPRQHMVVPLHCQLTGRQQSGSGWVRDFSSIGARVISNLPLTAGDELTVTLPKDGSPEITIAATVRWNQGQLFGLEFKHRSRD
jgi:PilZ domain-containing protein